MLDALATAYHTPDLRRVAHLSGRALITPNLTELAAMLAIDRTTSDRTRSAPSGRSPTRRGPRVLGGGETSVVASLDGRCWVTTAWPPGLATAGSGDVKAGAVVALCARGAAIEQAAA
ncbi:NAD(P)H-hydrate dehydratase [Humibacillus xanthopallidus]|uniref:NAD(P)H-hydrate dehydratase n=1 Tax=Humibacillus xanthopallidus TaxID=412689 RepID=UPI00384B5FFF